MLRSLFCVSMLALGLIASGQDTPEPANGAASFRFGLKVAPNVGYTHPESDELDFAETGSSISFGLLGDIGLGDHGTWWAGTGLVVSNIHSSYTMDATVDHGPGPTDVDGHVELRMRYLEIATLKWRTTTPGPFDFYAFAGGSAAFHLQSSVRGARTLTTPGSMGTTTNYDNESANDDMTSMKFALVGGAGIEYSLASGPTFFAGLMYSKAITSAMDKYAGTFVLYGGTTRIYPDYAEVAVGVYF